MSPGAYETNLDKVPPPGLNIIYAWNNFMYFTLLLFTLAALVSHWRLVQPAGWAYAAVVVCVCLLVGILLWNDPLQGTAECGAPSDPRIFRLPPPIVDQSILLRNHYFRHGSRDNGCPDNYRKRILKPGPSGSINLDNIAGEKSHIV